jgi:hypothetical protein
MKRLVFWLVIGWLVKHLTGESRHMPPELIHSPATCRWCGSHPVYRKRLGPNLYRYGCPEHRPSLMTCSEEEARRWA